MFFWFYAKISPMSNTQSIFKVYGTQFKIAGYTMSGIFTTAFIVLMIIFFAAPMTLATFFGNYGFRKIEFNLYAHVFKNTTVIEEQFFMFERAIDLNSQGEIVRWGSRLLASPHYQAFVREQDEEQEAKNAYRDENGNAILREDLIDRGIMTLEGLQFLDRTRITVASLDNYIQNQYVKALLGKGRVNEARAFAAESMNEHLIGQRELNAQTVFLYTTIASSVDLNSTEVANLIKFYDMLKIEISEKTHLFLHVNNPSHGHVSEEDRFELMVLNRRIREVAVVLDTIHQGAVPDFKNTETKSNAAEQNLSNIRDNMNLAIVDWVVL